VRAGKRLSATALRWSLLGAGLLALGLNALALGKPDWAKPFLEEPTPSGPFIAKTDMWVVLYEDVEFSLNDQGKIEERHRSIIENMSDKDRKYVKTLSYDEGITTLSGMALSVQRKYIWHDINLEKKSVQASESQGVTAIVTGAEEIPPHHRVVLEYTLGDKWGFLPWSSETVPGAYPIVKKRISINPAAAARGLTLEVVDGSSLDLPPSYVQGADGSWTVTAVPSYSRLPWDLALQPSYRFLYPYFVAYLKGEGSSWQGFAGKYEEAWKKNAAAMDAKQVQDKALALTGGLKTPMEKAKALARFVQNEVLYDDSNEKGMNGWLPLATEEMLRSMKADCKGKVMLLQSLLAAVGIESLPVMTKISDGYYAWGKTLATSDCNHVIIAVKPPPSTNPPPAALTEGPVKGWILFDATQTTADFGEAMPGLEGLPAMLGSGSASGFFVIHTRVPSAERTSISINAKLMSSDELEVEMTVADNGGSPLVTRLAQHYSSEKVRDRILDELSQVNARVNLVSHSLTRAADNPEGMTVFKVDFVALNARQALSNSSLLSNPLAVAAVMAGIPNGFKRTPPVKPEDKIDLEPPWDRKMNTEGTWSIVDVDLTLTLPLGFECEPPKPLADDLPWMQCKEEWKRLDRNTWRATLHLAMPRGEWPAAERKTRLVALDGLFRELYSPVMMKGAG
jgi:hypothetical protein